MIAALGVGGIAVSLGFQNTLSNLIAGLQISLMHIVKPGDIINVGTDTGVVKDVNWWNTTIIDEDGNTILIPNSKLVTSSLKHLLPANEVTVKIGLTVDGADVEAVSAAIEKEALHAAMKVGPVLHAPELDFTGISDFGFEAVLWFVMVRESDIDDATDAIIRAIAPLTHASNASKVLAQEQQKESADTQSLPPKVEEDAPSEVKAQLSSKATAEPLVDTGASPADVAAATMSTIEGVLLGKKPARRRIARVLASLKGRSHHHKRRKKASGEPLVKKTTSEDKNAKDKQ